MQDAAQVSHTLQNIFPILISKCGHIYQSYPDKNTPQKEQLKLQQRQIQPERGRE